MGYDVDRFIEPVNEGLLCSICRDVLEEPVQAPCEHAFCSLCIEGWLVHDNICPEDRRLLWSSDLRPLFRYMKNDLDALKLHCRNYSLGCEHVCQIDAIQRHEQDECEYELAQCPSSGCETYLQRRLIRDHLLTCEYRTTECERGCGMPINTAEKGGEHNCVFELRTAIELVRAEMLCKADEVKQEMDLRLDAQRRHMVQREARLQERIDDMHQAAVSLQQEVHTLKESLREERRDVEQLRIEKNELMDVVKSLQKELDARKHVCQYCTSRSIKITSL